MSDTIVVLIYIGFILAVGVAWIMWQRGGE